MSVNKILALLTNILEEDHRKNGGVNIGFDHYFLYIYTSRATRHYM